ncbi:MAG: ABC transporter substrate-binding protein [Saprospiraceae bacterium]
MISVQSHRLLSNGNKHFIFNLLLVLLVFACGTTKKSSTVKPTKRPEKPKLEDKTPKNLPEKIDTIQWKEEVPSKDDKIIVPDKDNPPTQTEKLPNTNSTDQLQLVALIPFKVDEIDTTSNKIPGQNLRFVHFYSGMKLALDELNQVKATYVQFDIFDTEEMDVSKNILQKYESKLPHIIIGPYKSDALKYAADWAKKNQTVVISPWISSSSITEKNPYYIQAKAGLNSHYQLISSHVRTHFPIENTILISRSKEESKARIFNDTLLHLSAIHEEFISEDDLAKNADPILEKYFKAEGPTIFILPLASTRDENYIYHFLRRVISEKKNKTVYVYGLSKWLEMKAEILEYINVLNVRLSISNFVDADKPEVVNFRKKYFNVYREFPSDDAMEGYDLTKFIVSSLRNYGEHFYTQEFKSNEKYLQTDFQLKPVYKNNNKLFSDIEYYENQYIKLIEIKNNRYKMID